MRGKVRAFLVWLAAIAWSIPGFGQILDSAEKLPLDTLFQSKRPLIRHRVVDTTPVEFVFNPGFSTAEEALDTLVAWILNKKAMPEYGFVSQDQFLRELRLHDTASPQAMAEGQYLNYVFQFQKSFQKLRAQIAKQRFTWRGVHIRPEKGQWRSSNGFPATRYIITLEKGKKKWELRYELWWLDDRAYWVNRLQFFLIETGS